MRGDICDGTLVGVGGDGCDGALGVCVSGSSSAVSAGRPSSSCSVCCRGCGWAAAVVAL